MKLIYSYIFLSIVAHLTGKVACSTVANISEVAEILERIKIHSAILSNFTHKHADKLKDTLDTAYNFVDLNLEKFEYNLEHLMGNVLAENADNPLDDPDDNETISEYNKLMQSFADRVSKWRKYISDKYDKLNNNIDNGVEKFDAILNSSMYLLERKINFLRERYPGIDSPQCSKAIQTLETNMKSIFNSVSSCVTNEVQEKVFDVNDMQSRSVKNMNKVLYKVQTMLNCTLTNDGSRIMKFIKCFNFSGIRVAWMFVTGMVKLAFKQFPFLNMPVDMSLGIVNCIQEKTKDELGNDILMSTVTTDAMMYTECAVQVG